MVRDFSTYSWEEIEAFLAEWGQAPFRAKQLFDWVYKQGVLEYSNMTNLPAGLRNQLAEQVPIHVPQVVDKQISADGTRKYLLKLYDGCLVETVGIPSRDTGASTAPRRLTVCFSSQVGCAMQCKFCATGQEGFTRNLSSFEMVGQVALVAKDFGARVSNVVGMGQGEPFLNYDNVLEALRIMNSPQALGIGARHISVSTCGITEGVVRFGAEPEQFTLAISLHSAQQETRDMLMPRLQGHSLDRIHHALKTYQQQSGRRISFEYLMIDGINTSQDALKDLISYCAGLDAHINLLPVNKVEGSLFAPCSVKHMQKWVVELGKAHIEASIRASRGSDIQGACGQLKNSVSARA